ncbi:two-component regulator propeller domain-containing protein [uncultured Tenacibaculum sp.]|uniref:ligand-binding sensor domain-containing protein n=1 Tax=uncultured Tenacibaculum sp. TaxID=174713 RepID=UPI002614F0EA|nr:two-component regulator propeller domain-containing protein [uncultured Tenacibaculum sp.]
MIKFVNASFETKNYCYFFTLKYVTFLLLLLSFKVTNAQHLYFKNYTAIDGLSSSEVYDITQDSHGYLWFATDRGLTSYDGKTFRRYTLSDGLPDNVIFNFYEQKDGTIWCTTQNHKLFYFKNKKEGFHEYKFNQSVLDHIAKKAIITNLVISEENDLLLGFQKLNGFLKISSSGKVTDTPYVVTPKNKRKYNFKIVNATPNFIFKDNDNHYKSSDVKLNWDLSYFDDNSNYTRILNFPKSKCKIATFGNYYSKIDASDQIMNQKKMKRSKGIAIMSGKYADDLFWMGYQYRGVTIVDLEGDVKQHLLENESVTKLFKDHEGGIWIATLNAGVFYCKNPSILYKSFRSYPIELTKDNNDELFLAFHNGEVLKKEETDFVSLYKSDKSYPAYVEFNKTKKHIYYGDYSQNSFLDKKRKLRFYIYGASDDAESTFGFTKNSFELLEDDVYKVIHVPERIFDISKNKDEVLIGTLGGLYTYKDKTLRLLKEESPLFSYRVTDIDSKFGNVYMTTMGKGLIIKKNETFFSIDKSDGLLSDICTEVFVEDPYTIWIGTNRGLNKVTLFKNNTYEIKELSVDQGLLCSEILDIELIKDKIYIASKEGLFSFSKDVMDSNKNIEKKWLQIDKVTLGNEVLPFKDFIELDCPNPDLKISFKSISFKNESNALYRYKIKENDEWNYTSNTSIDLPNLSHGNYLFKLQVKTDDDQWLECIQKSITVETPFWKTWWFSSLIFLITTVFVFSLFKFNVLTFNRKHFKAIYFTLLNKLRNKKEELYISIKSDGKIIKLISNEIGYFKSSRNYVEIYTENKKYLIRKKLDDFYYDLPDLVEYTKVHRSYYVRLDKVVEIKGNKEVSVFDATIPVSKTYAENLKRISA